MKKLFAVVLILTMLSSVALAALPDLSGLSLDELHQLRKNVSKEILSRSQWTEVEVPTGFYVVGEDIPAGHWMISPMEQDYALLEYFEKTDETGKNADIFGPYYGVSLGSPGNMLESMYNIQETDIELQAGYYIHIQFGSVIFKPFTGRKSPFFN